MLPATQHQRSQNISHTPWYSQHQNSPTQSCNSQKNTLKRLCAPTVIVNNTPIANLFNIQYSQLSFYTQMKIFDPTHTKLIYSDQLRSR